MGLQGADTVALRELAQRVASDSARIDDLLRTVTISAEALHWTGADRDTLVTRLQNATLQAETLNRALDEAAQDLARQVEAQDLASAAPPGALQPSTNFPPAPGQPLPGPDTPSPWTADITFGPDDFDPLHWLLTTGQNGASWTWDHLGVPVVNGLASFGQAMLDNPTATASMLLGLGMTGAGAGGATLGIVLLPTGAVSFGTGTAAGAGIVIGSTELMGAGAALTAGSGLLLINDAAKNPLTPARPLKTETYQPASGGGQPARPAKEVLAELPKGRSPRVRVVDNDAELQRVYDEMARGGTKRSKPGYKGDFVIQPDGVSIGLRRESTSGGRTIDVFYPDGGKAKVHIA